MSVFLSVFWHTEQQVHAYKSMTRAAGADACPQGRRLYILRDGCRSAAVPRLHRGGRAPPHLQVTGWAAAGHFLEEGEGEERGWRPIGTVFFVSPGTPTEENWPGISSVEEFKSYNFPKYKPQPLINHAPRYRASADCLSRRSRMIFVFVFFIYLRHSFWVCVAHGCFCHSHECHRQEILFFADSHALPSSREPLASYQPTSHTLNLVFVASRLDSEGIELLLSFLKVSFATHTPTSLLSCCTFFHRLPWYCHYLYAKLFKSHKAQPEQV